MTTNLKDFDLVKLSKLTSQQIDHVTCLECCKYFIAPATAACGHTLCHTCWRGRRTCPVCAIQLERKHLKLNIPLQTLTEHVLTLGEAFENLFKIKLDEFNLDSVDIESEKDPDKNVKDWLTSSQNHFSAPIQNSEPQSQDIPQHPNPLEVSASNIIIHSNNKKILSPKQVVHVQVPQDDWDNIEPMPEPEVNNKKSENIVGPMDIEPFFVDDTEYTTDHPRRSSRKREFRPDTSTAKIRENSVDKHSSRESDNDKQLHKTKNTWNNVKKMRKEFSKLNKKNRSKLNISIEMVKKTQTVKPVTVHIPQVTKQVYDIDENTPNTAKDNDNNANCNNRNPLIRNVNHKEIVTNNKLLTPIDKQEMIAQNDNVEETVIHANKTDETNKITYSKKSALDPGNKQDKIPIMVAPECNIQSAMPSDNSDDIEISIKIGSTITHIVIKKKTNDVQVKVNTDQGVQASLGSNGLVKANGPSENNVHNIAINVGGSDNMPTNNATKNVASNATNLNKSISLKKHTASADTATAQFEITESVEKELSNEMEIDNPATNVEPEKLNHVHIEKDKVYPQDNIEDLNDLDIFNSGSVKEGHVHTLKEPAPSEILISSVHSKVRTQKIPEKRVRENDEELLPKNKKTKKTNSKEENIDKNTLPDSEPINYDSFMGHVFASIDADIEDIKKTQEIQSSQKNDELTESGKKNKNTSKIPSQLCKTQTINKNSSQKTTTNTQKASGLNEDLLQKHSENVFSILEKEYEHSQIRNTDKIPQQVEELLTPILCRNLEGSQEGIESTNKPNEPEDYDDSDKSVVEETPQKNISIGKLKRASTINDSQISLNGTKKIATRKPESKSIISLTDTVTELDKTNRNETIIDNAGKKISVETPLTITKFTNHITHNSTPVAKKSLNFDNENDDPERTLCPTSEVIAKTTQEKEFMNKVFEKTPTSSVGKHLSRSFGLKNNKVFCLAGSCLRSIEILKVKILCNERKWKYVEKYTPDLTHLVVGVDEEKRSQRSVKYMCALAASKWIISFDWVEKCLQSKEVLNEEHFEALDSTGEPGPRRSRVAKHKLFQGIKFYCMPPFSVLDVDTLKSMLVVAGGEVVKGAEEVRVVEGTPPALLLAEPEHTQEDRFIYLAMEQCIVPVNYEWVLNCLGSYSLGSIQELLLCPTSLLPTGTATWPDVLISQED